MNGDFPRKSWLAALMLVGLTALAVGFASYQAGMSHGLALQPPPAVAAPPNAGAPQAAPGPAPYYYYPRYGRYRGWGGFGIFGGIFTLLIWIFLIRMLLRVFFGWGWGWRRRYWGGYGCHGGPHDGPREFDEWHRRAHDRMQEQGSTPA